MISWENRHIHTKAKRQKDNMTNNVEFKAKVIMEQIRDFYTAS